MSSDDVFLDRRRILAVCMESPLYFTMSLRKRFDFIKDLERRNYCSNVSEDLACVMNPGREE